MTGYDISTRVFNLSGYQNSDSHPESNPLILKRMPDIINQICADLKIPPIEELTDTVNANDKQLEALCYGSAMLLAVSESEVEKNQLFTQIYNAKRAAVLCGNGKIEDILPSVSHGVD